VRGRNSSNGGKRPYLKPGVWRVTDDLSGFQIGSDMVKKTWDGFLCDANNTWYPRQPQDFPLITRGVTSVVDARPLNSYTVEGAYNYHVAGTNDDNYLTFQDGSLIEFAFYQNEYVGNQA
jgi:hypothetical protein